MALGLLANYPDSALGQLCVGSDLGRSRLHLSGDGILFQHARNWLGTCRLPLTENISEIEELCAYLDKRDTTYEPMKDALKCYLKQQMPAESRDYKTGDSEHTDLVLADHSNVGLILKVEHPPVLGSDGFRACNEVSVVYSTQLDGSGLDTPKTRALSKDVVFLTFPLSHEEIFYARKCHFFLTDVILDSVRQKDPKEITAKVGTLVNRLWTQQIAPMEFVSDLLNVEYFKGDRNVHRELLQWVELHRATSNNVDLRFGLIIDPLRSNPVGLSCHHHPTLL
ncbi:BTB/POZ domain-containing protein KCTD19 [Grus japonensis]|uniref:BTB/POZ domain-containing protein KCTD19 n=1 Tax=Grus japonensis TaxID=30415 RepID=A0ABC9XFA8_GRUJA